MKRPICLFLVFLTLVAIAATMDSTKINPTQFGFASGSLYITNNVQLTNQTTYGSAARTNAMYLGPSGLTVSNAVGRVVTTSGNINMSGIITATNANLKSATNTGTFVNIGSILERGTAGAFPEAGIRLMPNGNPVNNFYGSIGNASLLDLFSTDFSTNSSDYQRVFFLASSNMNQLLTSFKGTRGPNPLVLGKYADATGTFTEWGRFDTNGFLLINTTASDGTSKLQVNGSGSFSTNVYVTNLTAAIGGLKVGPGTTITNIVSATAALDFGNILAAASADLTITVAGAKANDGVFLGLPVDPDASLVFNAFVSSANTVTVRAFNVGAIAVDQASKTFRVVVNQF